MIWLGVLGVASAIEARAIRRHRGTASEAIATLFRTETLPGKLAFSAVLAVGALWLDAHIVTFEYTAGRQGDDGLPTRGPRRHGRVGS